MMAKTPWKEYREHEQTYRIQAHYGWQTVPGNPGPYWSVTGAIDRKDRGLWREDSGGVLHGEIAEHFPALAPTLKWHLCCEGSGPLHYEANARYWLEHYYGRSKWALKSYDPNPLEAFKRTVVFGAVASDTDPANPYAETCHALDGTTERLPTLETLAAWCGARLPGLLATMKAETDAVLGLETLPR